MEHTSAWFDAQAVLEQQKLSLLDAHCHAQHSEHFLEQVQQLAPCGARFFCMTETPEEYRRYQEISNWPSNALLGLGLHPWSVSAAAEERAAQLACFTSLLPGVLLVGEVGLDFGQAHKQTQGAQLEAFKAIAAACAQAGGKILSIHAVHAAGQILDILEKTGAWESNICIFHWFSGSQPELERAIAADCYFSAGLRMLQSKRGCAYVKRIPAQRLLYESDSFQVELPQDVTISYEETVTRSVAASS